MTTVGLIGSGNIGTAVARLAIDAGHHVVLSNSRSPDTLRDTAAQLGPRASAATSAEAAAAGDIVVVTVPVKSFPNLPAAPLAGKTVIDTCNYGPERDGNIPELDSNSITSSELLLRCIPDAMLVKAFNNIFFKHLLSLARQRGRPTARTCRSPETPPGRRPRWPSSSNRLVTAWSTLGRWPTAGDRAPTRRCGGRPTGHTRTSWANRPVRTSSAQHWASQRGNHTVLPGRAESVRSEGGKPSPRTGPGHPRADARKRSSTTAGTVSALRTSNVNRRDVPASGPAAGRNLGVGR
jgi:predicted dinucleotide-binding enzyme